MKGRYRKVLSWKLEEYLPSDVSIPKQKADLEGKPPPPPFEFVYVCVGGGG
jgi:hypothetical protein